MIQLLDFMRKVQCGYSVILLLLGFNAVLRADDEKKTERPKLLAPVQRFEGHSADVLGSAFSRDGQKIVTSSMDQTIRIWSVESGKEVLRMNTPNSRVDCVMFSPTEKFIVAAGKEDFGVRLYDSATGAERRRIPLATHVRDLVFCPNRNWLLAGTDPDGVIHRFSADSWKLARTTIAPSPVFALAVSSDSKRMLSANVTNDTVTLWELMSGKEIRKFGPHGARVNSVAFSPDDATIVSSCAPGNGESGEATIYFWEPSSGRELARIRPGVRTLGHVQFSPDGSLLMAGSMESVFIWRISDRVLIQVLDVKSYRPVFSPDGTAVLIASSGNSFSLWRFAK